jgi:hypothetical protein
MTAAAQRAITKNPAAASRLLAAGIGHANKNNPNASGNSTAAAAAAQRAITKNPVAASRLLAAGINHAGSSPGGPGNSAATGDNDHTSAGLNVGRVAAASQAFSAPHGKPSSPPVAQKGPDANKLVPQKVSSVVLCHCS